MPSLFPINVVEKTNNTKKISLQQESDFWQSVEDCLNNIISRGGFSASQVSLKLPDKETVLEAADYDSNISAIESSINAIINNGEPYGFNAENDLVLFKRGDPEDEEATPLTIYHRDSNCITIEVFLNTANELLKWAGK